LTKEEGITSMRKCFSAPRWFVEDYDKPVSSNFAWISIQEEDQPNAAPPRFYPPSKNQYLDKLNTLKLKFSDVTGVIEEKGLKSFHKSKFYNPPTKRHAKQIVDFILANEGKNFIVNCAAGISRSGAVCKFLHDMMGYDWNELGAETPRPNKVLYPMLVEYYQKHLKKEENVHKIERPQS
jgi:hypothetical protein